MLRLSPTRITLDAQDIERHAINGKKIIKQMNSKSMKKPNVFGYPFPPLAKSQSMAVQEFINETKVRSEEMDSQYRISEQLLRDTLFPKRKGDQSYDKLNKWSKLEPASRKLAPVQRNIQGLWDLAAHHFADC